MSDPNGTKKISVVHYVYLCIIAALVLVYFGTLSLYNDAEAVSKLDFASMVVSIILAVIAIIYTFVSGEGQKLSVVQLQAAVNSLGEQIEQMNVVLDKTGQQLSSVVTLSEGFETLVNANTETRNDFTKLMVEIQDSVAAMQAKDGDVKDALEKLAGKIHDTVQRNELDNVIPTKGGGALHAVGRVVEVSASGGSTSSGTASLLVFSSEEMRLARELKQFLDRNPSATLSEIIIKANEYCVLHRMFVPSARRMEELINYARSM